EPVMAEPNHHDRQRPERHTDHQQVGHAESAVTHADHHSSQDGAMGHDGHEHHDHAAGGHGQEDQHHVGHEMHGGHAGHGDHGDHVGQFRRLFWIMLVLGIPVVAFNPMFADRKSTRLNSSHVSISYAVFCL